MSENNRPLRIAPIEVDQRVGEVRELLDRSSAGTGPDANIFTTFVRAPRLFSRWLPFGGRLLRGALPARDRELLILRTGWNCGAEYEWAQHARIALSCDLTSEEVDRVASGPDDPAWSDADATLLRAADELHATWTLSDATWSKLASTYDVEQLIELPMLVGHYHMVAMTLNTLGVRIDEGLAGFPSPPA